MAPDQRHGGGQRREGDGEGAQADAGQEQDRDAAEHDQDGGAEIGLAQHQRRRRGHHQQRHQQPAELPDLLLAAGMEIARQRQHQRQLHDLRRLQVEDPDRDPALGAALDRARRLDHHQQTQRAEVAGVREAVPEADVDQGDDEHRHRPDREANELAHDPALAAAAGGGIESQQADAGDCQHHQDQTPVQRPDLAPERQLDRARAERGVERAPAEGHSPHPPAAPAATPAKSALGTASGLRVCA